MADRGFDRASMSEVARAAGLTQGLLHYHFRNKEQMLLAAMALLAEQHIEALDAALISPSSAAAALETFIDFHLELGDRSDPATLAWTGLVLLAFAGHLVWASRRRIRSFEALYFVASDALWVAGTAVLVVAYPSQLSSAGRWTAMAVAVVVGGLALAQLIGLSQARRTAG